MKNSFHRIALVTVKPSCDDDNYHVMWNIGKKGKMISELVKRSKCD